MIDQPGALAYTMLRRLIVGAILLAVPLCPASGQTSPDPVWIQGGPYRLKTAVFQGADSSATPTLVVILHGDSHFGKPDYQDQFARRVAASYRAVVAAAVLRPGYTDPAGNTSDGVRGDTTGDNYNARNTDAIAAAIRALAQRFHSPRVVVVGHSGGAALAANILGRQPDLIDAALLVSCPCDVTRWRAHMLATTRFAGFRGPIETLSPIDLVGGIADQVTIHMLVGSEDTVAPPALSEAYQAAAQKLGKPITLTLVPGEGHDILLHPGILTALAPLVH